MVRQARRDYVVKTDVVSRFRSLIFSSGQFSSFRITFLFPILLTVVFFPNSGIVSTSLPKACASFSLSVSDGDMIFSRFFSVSIRLAPNIMTY